MPTCAECGFASEEPFRFCPDCGSEAAAETSPEQRRVVTVVFCDLAGSTALGESVDPERLRVVLAGYFERMKGIVEAHGGTVEKFIGDAVMAVFGVPVVHEDDALRAVRAAHEMRDALPELGLEGRIGVMTGEVVTGTSERLVTGDAVNVAARLEQAAAAGEVLIGEPTYALVRDAVDVEPVEPLALRGKTQPVAAHRLNRVLDAPERPHDTPFVGRAGELAALREAFQRAAAEQRCELVTVLGEAGIGKSRLVAEALTGLHATIARGRCLPYGEGITYWPVVEVLKQLRTLPPEETAAHVIRALLGETSATTSADEIAWAFRKTLEHAAADQALIVVFDDIQWGESTFHDLIEHVALLSTGAPILLVCMARPELVERRPAWPVALRLDPLDGDSVDRLIPTALPAELRERIARSAAGNPLFMSEMLAIAAHTEGEVAVPPTLRALLAARLDQLEPAERRTLEYGSVEGEVFHRGAVQALSLDGTPVIPQLAALARKRLIAPHRPLIPGDDGFRFHHLLLRDTAYDGLPKKARADLHQRYASWLTLHGTDLVELDEILGHHLEQAHLYRSDLGLPADDELAETARQRLTSSGVRALRRQDYPAAARLLERVAALVPSSEVDMALEIELAGALVWTGRTDEALLRADALAERAVAAGDHLGDLGARVHAAALRINTESGAAAELDALLEEALPVFEAAGDDVVLHIGYSARCDAANVRGHYQEAAGAWERALTHAERAGFRRSDALGYRAYLLFVGPTPVSELLAWLDEVEPEDRRDQFLRAYRAWSLARLGQFDEARAIVADLRTQHAERGHNLLLANLTSFESVWIELLAGDPDAAAEFGAEGLRLQQELGDSGHLPLAAASLAHALYTADRLQESDAMVARAEASEESDEAWSRALCRQVKGKLLARRGDHAEAARLAREAVAIADDTDALDLQGDAYADLAAVLSLAGKPDEAVEALEQALDRFERKGNIVMAVRTRERLSEFESTTAR